MTDLPEDEPDPRFDASMLALVAQAVGFIVAIYEIDDDLIYLSEQWSLLTRGEAVPAYASPDEFRAQLHPDDAMAVARSLGKCLRGESEHWDAEMRVRTVSGEWRWLLLQARITGRNEFGKPQRLMGAMFDITNYRHSSAAGKVAAERSLNRVTRMYEARKQCSKLIVLSKSRDSMLSEVCRVAATAPELALAWVGAVDPATLAVTPMARSGEEAAFLDAAYFSADARVEEGCGPVGRAVRENRAQVSNDFLSDPEAAPWRALAGRHGMRSVAVLPLGQDNTQACVLVLHAREPDFFDPQLLELLMELAQEISFGLENLQRDAALHESESRFRTLWETALDAIVIFDEQSVVHYANPAVTSIFGYRIEEVIGRSFRMLYPPAQGEAHERAMQRYLATPLPGSRWRAVSSIGRYKDGRNFPIEITFSDVVIDGVRRFIGYVRDVTQRKHAEQLNRKQNNILRRIAAGAGLEPTLEAIARLVESEVEGVSCAFLVADDGAAGFTQCVAPSFPVASTRALLGAGISPAAGPAGAAAARREPVLVPDLSAAAEWANTVWPGLSRGVHACFCWPMVGRSSRLLGVMMIKRRVAGALAQAQIRAAQLALDLGGVAIESRRSDETIRYLANCDELTGLANRAALTQALGTAIARARRGEGRVGVLFVDLDRFKNINDTLGHEAGDVVLREIAHRLQTVLRKGDLVARWGGDEFIVMVEQYLDVGVLTRIADKLVNMISAPVSVADTECHVTASVGICTWPDDGPDPESLLRNADMAMYRAKEQGRNGFRFYSAQMGNSSMERMQLESGLRRAVENDELVLHFQPKLDLLSGEITGIEALVRWQHPQQGLIWPLKFIQLAEETGHIIAIGRTVLRSACRQMREWQMAGLTCGRIAVNLSARQLASESLVSDVASALQDSGLPPGMLELEITESMVMNNARAGLKLLGELRAMGVHLSMDDFGTGYSSLANIKRYPIDSVKIDRSFIRDLPHDSNDAAITQAVLAMAHALKLRVVAEGVETEAQLNFLHEQKCDEIQGYYFSRPVTAAVLEDFMRRYISSDRISLALRGERAKPPGQLLPARDQS
ncbi:EAL domain-containing protein [Lacisediminimonas profundi]|uniref:EAL domain-containing protein n=1 Tax=Lacisediminimonas profundi TaxID=2603856 RepID=UPI00124B148A|nr:EAL domain-containing protein [Lacisediminimonas profundi]